MFVLKTDHLRTAETSQTHELHDNLVSDISPKLYFFHELSVFVLQKGSRETGRFRELFHSLHGTFADIPRFERFAEKYLHVAEFSVNGVSTLSLLYETVLVVETVSCGASLKVKGFFVQGFIESYELPDVGK